MPKFKIVVSMTAVWEEELEFDNEDEARDFVYSPDYYLPDDVSSWENFELLEIEEIEDGQS